MFFALRICDQTELFELRSVFDRHFGLIFGLIPNSYLRSKIRLGMYRIRLAGYPAIFSVSSSGCGSIQNADRYRISHRISHLH